MSVIEERSYGSESHVLDISQVIDNSLECPTTIDSIARVTSIRSRAIRSSKTISKDLINGLRTPLSWYQSRDRGWGQSYKSSCSELHDVELYEWSVQRGNSNWLSWLKEHRGPWIPSYILATSNQNLDSATMGWNKAVRSCSWRVVAWDLPRFSQDPSRSLRS